MLSLLLNSFLPVAFLILLGFVSAKKKVFNYKQSLAILKYVGVVAVPALTLKMIISINLSNLNWVLLSGYILSELIIYIIAALLATIGHFFSIEALKVINASFAAPFVYLTVLLAAFWGFFIYNEIPDNSTILGAFLIILAGIIISRLKIK